MRRSIAIATLLAVVGLFFTALPSSANGGRAESIEVGVAWQGKSTMPERVLSGLQKALAENAPQIRLEVRRELAGEEELAAAVSDFETSKRAMVILRSSGAQLLGRRGAAIPAFIGGTSDPVFLGAAESLTRPRRNITGVTYSLPARLKLETFRQVYPAMSRYLLLVEAGHPGTPIDVDDTASAAAAMGLSGRAVSSATLAEVLAAVRQAEADEVIILGLQALVMDNVAAIIREAGERLVFSYSEQAVEEGALAGVVADDYKLGKILAMKLIDVLLHGKAIAEIPIQTDPEPRLRLNFGTVERFRDKIPFAVRSLAKSEQLLTSILKSAPTGIGSVQNRVITEVNDYILELTGYSREELIGKSARILYPTQAESDYVGREKYRQISEKGTGSVETRWLRKDGSIRQVILSSTPLDPKDLTLGVTFTVLDITERKQVEEELALRTRWFMFGSVAFIVVLLALVARLVASLRQRNLTAKALQASEEKLATLFASMTEMVVLHTLEYNQAGEPVNYRITEVNAAFTRITGIARENAVGRLATEVYGTEDPPYLKEFAQVAISGKPCEYSTYFEAMDKHFAISVVSPARGCFATVTADVTERMKVQELIAAKNKELENYLYVASHDLRSPLVNVQGFSKRLQKHATAIAAILAETPLAASTRTALDQVITKDIPKTLDFIQTNVAKMDTLLTGLLTISRTGRARMAIAAVDVGRLFKTILDGHAFQLAEIGATVDCAELPPCYGDETLLNQLFSNLLGNAIKYRAEGRPLVIGITGETRGRKVVYSLSDNGRGIDPRHLPRIWDVFYRVDASLPDSGDGLGLNIVKRIAEKHQGRVWAVSEPGWGSVFHVELQSGMFAE
jgi:PAS domain S-box-containing protein